MKEIVKEIKSTKRVYVATDDTEFVSKEECQKYEESARCAMLAKYNQRILKKSDEFSISGFGCEDNNIDIVRIETESDVDMILQLLFLISPHLKQDSHKEYVGKITRSLNRALEEKDCVFIYRGYEYDSFRFSSTRNEHIDVLKKIGEPDENA